MFVKKRTSNLLYSIPGRNDSLKTVLPFYVCEDHEKRELTKEVTQLKDKLAKKDEIIAEVAEAFVSLKKELGEP